MSRLPPLEELVNLFEVEEVARQRLAPELFESIAAGAGAGLTLGRNREAFDRITLRPRVLVDVRAMDLGTQLLGRKLETPILVAPTSRQTLLHPEGELATLRGAAAAKATVVLSSRPGIPLERIAAQARGAFWCQLEPETGAGEFRQLVRRATDAGAQALCLSAGWRGEKPAPPVDWTLVARVREWTPAPLWIKGILAPGEARTAVEKGAQGIIVSNYGGRLVDGAMAAIEALPAVVEAVGRHVPVLIDSGFRRGTDVLKALALGANGVMLGRPPLWGLAAYGAEGVQKVLELIQTELALAMGLCGKPNLAAIDRSLVKIHKR
ncbi:MAG TPA: alpha-hydroxy-acid oxidizing protein [Bryobacteraceae bacterium]|nr:alpha-hydroxy-acid oxidizing protein [Bryobacteraceae bacterium]